VFKIFYLYNEYYIAEIVIMNKVAGLLLLCVGSWLMIFVVAGTIAASISDGEPTAGLGWIAAKMSGVVAVVAAGSYLLLRHPPQSWEPSGHMDGPTSHRGLTRHRRRIAGDWSTHGALAVVILVLLALLTSTLVRWSLPH
jgi:hypothetical protein